MVSTSIRLPQSLVDKVCAPRRPRWVSRDDANATVGHRKGDHPWPMPWSPSRNSSISLPSTTDQSLPSLARRLPTRNTTRLETVSPRPFGLHFPVELIRLEP